MSTRIEGHTKVGGPEWFVKSWEVDTHLFECFNKVMAWFDPQVSHPTQPIIHSLNTPISILMEEKIIFNISGDSVDMIFLIMALRTLV